MPTPTTVRTPRSGAARRPVRTASGRVSSRSVSRDREPRPRPPGPAVAAEGMWLDLAAQVLLGAPDDLPAEPVAVRLLVTFDAVFCSFSAGVAAAGAVAPSGGVAGAGGAGTSGGVAAAGGAGTSGDVVAAGGAATSGGVIAAGGAAVDGGPARCGVGHRWTVTAPGSAGPRRYVGGSSPEGSWAAALPPEAEAHPGNRGWTAAGAAHRLVLPLGAERDRAFVVGRVEPFTAADLELARRLQRLLRGLDRWLAGGGSPDCSSGPLLHRTSQQRPAAAARLQQRTAAAAAPAPLTDRELSVLLLLAEGLKAESIGRRLSIAHRTVHKHLERIYGKLGVTDRLAAVLRAQETGLLDRAPARRSEARGA